LGIARHIAFENNHNNYPIEDAAHIALRAIIGYIGEHLEIKLVRYVLYDARAFEIHKQVLEEMMAEYKKLSGLAEGESDSFL
jgi:hypothetical protein